MIEHNDTLTDIRRFILNLVNHDEQIAQDIVIDLWRYDLSNFDPHHGVPLDGFLRAAARRHIRKYLGRAKARQYRRMAAEHEVAQQIAQRQLKSPPRHDAPDLADIERAAKDIDTYGHQRRLLRLWLSNPGQQLNHLGRLAGYRHKASTYRAMRQIKQRLRNATQQN